MTRGNEEGRTGHPNVYKFLLLVYRWGVLHSKMVLILGERLENIWQSVWVNLTPLREAGRLMPELYGPEPLGLRRYTFAVRKSPDVLV